VRAVLFDDDVTRDGELLRKWMLGWAGLDGDGARARETGASDWGREAAAVTGGEDHGR